MDGSWDIEWVSYLRMDIGSHPSVILWDGGQWYFDSRVDFAPLLELDGDNLTIEPKVTARGIKPAGAPEVPVNVTLAICGPGRDLID